MEPENRHPLRFKIFKELKVPIESVSSPEIPVLEISNSNRVVLLGWIFGKTPLRRSLAPNLRFSNFGTRKKLCVKVPRRLVNSRFRYLKEEEEIFTGIGDEMLIAERETTSKFVRF